MSERDYYSSLLLLVTERLEGSSSALDQQLYGYFRSLRLAEEGAVFSHNPRPPIVVLDQAIVDIDREARKDSNSLQKGFSGVTSFFLLFTAEIRKIICGNRKTPAKLGHEMNAVLAALAAFVTNKLGVSSPTAIALAVLILLTITQATKNAFCKMSDIEAYKAIRAEREKS